MNENETTEHVQGQSTEVHKSEELFEAIRSLGDRRILLVVDRGLIQFGKFITVQIAIFGIIGIFFFGADIKSALKEVRDTRQSMEDVQKELNQTRTDLHTAKETLNKEQVTFKAELTEANDAVAELKQRVKELRIEADLHLAKIKGLRTEAEQQVVLIRQLTVEQQVELTRVSESEFKEMIRTNNLSDAATDTERMQAKKLQLWTIGATLRIRFLDGTKQEQEEVKTIASEWTKYANIRFKFVSSGVSHVRITLRPKNFEPEWPAWGYQGTASLGIDQDKPTIGIDVANELSSFGWDFSDEKVKKGSILRQFGFMLGLIEEMKNPGVPWRDQINADAFNDWERGHYIPYSESELPNYRPFDAQSVMLNYVPKELSGRDAVIGGKNYELSDGDKAIIRQLYPE